MVSNASEDFPDPETPLITVSSPWGISQEMFFRLWVRAPRITIASFDEVNGKTPERDRACVPVALARVRTQNPNFYYRRSGSRAHHLLLRRDGRPRRARCTHVRHGGTARRRINGLCVLRSDCSCCRAWSNVGEAGQGDLRFDLISIQNRGQIHQ